MERSNYLYRILGLFLIDTSQSILGTQKNYDSIPVDVSGGAPPNKTHELFDEINATMYELKIGNNPNELSGHFVILSTNTMNTFMSCKLIKK